MRSNIRRAAGTQTFADVLKIWFGGKRPSPAQDVADYAAGITLEVSCFSRTPSEPKARPRLGTLRLTRGEPVTWRRRGAAITFSPPMQLADSAEKAMGPQFTALTLVAASGSVDVQVPSLDVELLRHALDDAHA